jgi:hypothetical protein
MDMTFPLGSVVILCMFRKGEGVRIWMKTVLDCLKVVYGHSLNSYCGQSRRTSVMTGNQVVMRTAYLLHAT